MATNPVTAGNSTQNSNTSAVRDRMEDLDVEAFLKLMIAELQNQDPLNPMDNAQMIQQMGEIRSIASTDKLSNTLDSVQLGQALASASSMIGKHITGLSDENAEVKGVVDRVTVARGVPKVHIGPNSVGLSNVREIVNAN